MFVCQLDFETIKIAFGKINVVLERYGSLSLNKFAGIFERQSEFACALQIKLSSVSNVLWFISVEPWYLIYLFISFVHSVDSLYYVKN